MQLQLERNVRRGSWQYGNAMPCRNMAMPGRIMACRSCVKITLPVSQQTPKARNHGDYLAFSDVKITGNHLESQDYELHYEVFFIQ